VVFSEAFQRYREKLVVNKTLFFAGDVDASREETCIRVHAVYRPREAPHELAGMVQVRLPDHAPVKDLREILGHYHGERPVLLSMEPEPGLHLTVRAGKALGVDPTPEFVAEVRTLVGESNVRILPAAPGARRPRRNGRRGRPNGPK
jgi:DNA polymerase III alpha subunit